MEKRKFSVVEDKNKKCSPESPCQHPSAGQSALLDGHFLLEDPEPPHADPGPPRVPAAGQVPHMGGDDQIHRHNTIVHSMCLFLSPSLQFKTRTKKLNVIIVLKNLYDNESSI